MRKKLFPLRALTEIFPITYARAAGLAREGLLPTVKLGRQYFIDPDQLDEFIRNGGKARDGPGGWRREALEK